MYSPSRWSAAVSLMAAVAMPAWAQFDSIGGRAEFRSTDLPIGAPTLRIPESAGLSPDSGKFFGVGPPPPVEVLKRIDIDLGRPGPTATAGSDTRPPGSLYNAGEHLEKRAPASSAYKSSPQ
jgi:hypothetical protein